MRVVVGLWLIAVASAILVSCGSSTSSGLRQEDWATIGAYHQEVELLRTEVAILMTTVPTSAPATPALPVAQAWMIAVAGVSSAPVLPNYANESDAPLDLEARGIFLAIRLTVTNLSPEPVTRFPWWDLRVRDRQGRLYTPNRDATTSFIVAETNIARSRPEEYQPGLPYDEAVVFDLPPDVLELVLISDDDTLTLPLPALSLATPIGQ